ncbi:MAG: hypothetical protein IJ682_10210 [Lachnospiraceae bacterium]|nr:hypothetical protein [Lachnospiraceae bacterium]
MTLMQEAYLLMQKQPESNLRIIVDMLHAMSIKHPTVDVSVNAQPFKRTGQAKGVFNLPADFDEHFDDMNDEIAAMFYGDEA